MTTVAQQLRDVGYKPTKGERQMMTHNLELIRLAEFNKRLDEVVTSLIKPRVIQFQKAGSHVRARYQGERTFVIGADKRQAAMRLEFWLKEGKA